MPNNELDEKNFSEPKLPLATPIVGFALAVILGFFLSKSQGFSNGYAIDDYFNRFAESAGVIDFVLSQGRFTWALYVKLLSLAGLNQLDFGVIGMFLLGVASAFFYIVAFRPLLSTRSNFLVAVCASFLLGVHPYFTEYVSFRITLMPMAIMMALCACAVLYFDRFLRDGGRNELLIALVSAVFAIGANQLALSFLATGIFLRSGIVRAIEQGDSESWKSVTSALIRSVIFLVCAIALYYVVVLATTSGAGAAAGSDKRATMLAVSEIPSRLMLVGKQIWTIVQENENFLSRTAKVLILLSMGIAFFAAIISEPKRALLGLAVVAIIFVLALLPVSIAAVWWPAPRTLIAIPMAFSAGILFWTRGFAKPSVSSGVVVAALGLTCMLLAVHSSKILLNQQRLNRWDMQLAAQIASRAGERFPNAKSLAVVGAPYAYGIDPQMPSGDMNLSALSVPYAIDPLFEEATGRQLEIRLAPELVAECSSRKSFPDDEGIFVKGEETVICMASK